MRRTQGKDREAAPGERLHRSFGVLVFLGAVLVLGGIVGLIYTGVATLTSVLLFGCLLLTGGTVGLVHAFQTRRDNFFWLGASVAAVNLAAGLVMVLHPTVAAVGLTLFAALLFLTAGVFRVVGGLAVRGSQSGWTVFLGLLDLLLGALVLHQWPSSSLYTLGLFFSLALLFDGLSLIGTGIGGRRVIGMVDEDRRNAEVRSYLAGREHARGAARGRRREGAPQEERGGDASGSRPGGTGKPPTPPMGI
ncbi:HdeD family acid-resistance protein [Streptomyces sp. NPDC092296]|uniref:HdeD family acid-resistance protein n=1 Tax=Streptomyces sp. NPDC092296 TaxID=3366012 RepID=UPI0037FE7DF0